MDHQRNRWAEGMVWRHQSGHSRTRAGGPDREPWIRARSTWEMQRLLEQSRVSNGSGPYSPAAWTEGPTGDRALALDVYLDPSLGDGTTFTLAAAIRLLDKEGPGQFRYFFVPVRKNEGKLFVAGHEVPGAGHRGRSGVGEAYSDVSSFAEGELGRGSPGRSGRRPHLRKNPERSQRCTARTICPSWTLKKVMPVTDTVRCVAGI